MFSKTADPSTAPARPSTGLAGSNSRSVLSADLRITGEISSTGTIEVLGEVEALAEGRLGHDAGCRIVQIS